MGPMLDAAWQRRPPRKRPERLTTGGEAAREVESRFAIEPSDHVMGLIGRISRVLLELERTAPWAAEVLEAYYGDLGASWRATPVGRIVTLYPMTDAAGQDRTAAECAARFSSLDPLTCLKLDTEARELLRVALQEYEAAANRVGNTPSLLEK